MSRANQGERSGFIGRTRHDGVFNFCPDVRPEDAQVFVQLSPHRRLGEGTIQILSENHLAVLPERFPPAACGVPAGVIGVKVELRLTVKVTLSPGHSHVHLC